MLNPTSILKLKSAKDRFAQNHPKFIAFMQSVYAKGLEEDMVIEVSVTKPGEETRTANIKVRQSDLELLEELKELF